MNRIFYRKKGYYLTHPNIWFSDLARGIKYCYQRIKRGYSDVDVWNMDCWFLKIIPSMLRQLTNGKAYPGIAPFETPEKWENWLLDIAAKIESASEDYQNEHNKYYKDYMDTITGTVTYDKDYIKEVREKYNECAQELYEEGERNLHYAMTELGKNLGHLWD